MAWNILINDGMEESGIQALREAGFEISTHKLDAAQLMDGLKDYQGIVIRSATQVRQELIDAAPGLKFIARGGVGLDNVDVRYAESKGIRVINTPAASSRSVAELALGHMLSLSRGLQEAQRNLKDAESFKNLKKKYGNASELSGKVLLLIGCGRIGRELARMAIGLGMEPRVYDPFVEEIVLDLRLASQEISLHLPLVSLEEGLREADFISLHAPYTGKALLSDAEFAAMKKTAYVINTSRGENMDEAALLRALENGNIAGAGLDVFQGEPHILPELLNHPAISISPHIGASTSEAQGRIAAELVERIIGLYQELGA
jgi:D-3-phosphoglycerate dehydrogenase